PYGPQLYCCNHQRPVAGQTIAQNARRLMSYVVTENCIKCKYMDCVEVCPVDCFHEGDSMLVIDPEQCIDCGICVPECAAKAILPDADSELKQWAAFNR